MLVLPARPGATLHLVLRLRGDGKAAGKAVASSSASGAGEAGGEEYESLNATQMSGLSEQVWERRSPWCVPCSGDGHQPPPNPQRSFPPAHPRRVVWRSAFPWYMP